MRTQRLALQKFTGCVFLFFFFIPPIEEDRPIKHLIQPGTGVSLCPAKQHNSYTIYALSKVQVASELLGHTCQLIQPLDYAPHCL